MESFDLFFGVRVTKLKKKGVTKRQHIEQKKEY